ncbi:hypothetical protein CLV63_11327 [Murinocardiopsis flavida]|uniref:Uncharacterized protein n=1 Tax=Murinocardiopsis flavida TaxID=645275 RepID=A0A2P8DF76_9ACTN|nr:DUF5685 family protein [Murinocardiopsis flavida]PSK95864.1 hypothetical protein CLV63_11327 [Murinocardiopsis flavida]
MFGILRPCRHTLPDDLPAAWLAHLCGLCIALRDEHGQFARVATNYDALVISVLVAAQEGASAPTRAAGPCPLRGMRTAEVADGHGARLAAAVSLLLAATRLDDHARDRDGVYARRGARTAARAVAGRWEAKAGASSRGLGFESGAVLAVLDRQGDVESAAGPGSDILAVTGPTEYATAQAFAHTAVLAGLPGNVAPLREAGRLFGRIAHLLDAVADQDEDRASGAWNPITATGTAPAEVRRLCDDAALGVRFALEEAAFADDRLVRALLVRELRRSVGRAFAQAGHPPPHRGDANGRHPNDGYGDGDGHGRYSGAGDGWHPHNEDPVNTADHPDYAGYGGGDEGRRPLDDQGGSCCNCGCRTPKIYQPPKRRGPIAGCGVALFMCCTCQQCCRDPYPGPWSGQRHTTGTPDCPDCGCCECCGACDCGL